MIANIRMPRIAAPIPAGTRRSGDPESPVADGAEEETIVPSGWIVTGTVVLVVSGTAVVITTAGRVVTAGVVSPDVTVI
jgi:hypothetical protein